MPGRCDVFAWGYNRPVAMRALPETCSVHARLFRGPLMSIENWCCAGHDTPGKTEEWCDDDQIVITRRGSWELTVQGVPQLADPTVATMWNRHAEYRVRHPARGGDRCTIFRLSEAGSRALREACAAQSGGGQYAKTFARRAVPLDARAYLHHRRVLEAASAGAAGAMATTLALEESAFDLIGALCATAASAPESPRHRRDVVGRVREILATRFAQPLSVQGIAEAVACSPFHLSRLFRRETGLTIHRALNRLRLREGLERLLDEPTQISRIALDVGFASHSHFSDAFRAEYGFSPRHGRVIQRAL